MKAAIAVVVSAISLVIPSRCFALGDLEIVTKERAKVLGADVRTTASGPNHVQVNLEFKAVGNLKNADSVELRIGKGDDWTVAATLREDRSKPGRVAVSVTVNRAELDKVSLRVLVPHVDGEAGGSIYEFRVKDYIESKPLR